LTTSHPEAAVLNWTSAILGGEVTVERGMRQGGSPWLVHAGDRSAVLRVAAAEDAGRVGTEVAAMRYATAAGLPAPEVLGHDDSTATGFALVLTSMLPGDSQIPTEAHGRRLRMMGGIAARICAVDLVPSDALPPRSGPIEDMPWARLRHERGASDLLMRAEKVVDGTGPQDTRIAFTHGDLWQGNILWDDTGSLTAVLDWDAAGAGSPGIDLGSVRLEAVLCFGLDSAAEVLAGWEEQAGRAASDVPYWDAVAALATPPDMGWVAPVIADQGRSDLTGDILNERREAFLLAALSQLDPHQPSPAA
jgi:aminoglycoside phosphotransferase (APT) family kinase protein